MNDAKRIRRRKIKMKGIIKWVKGEENIETNRNGGMHSKLLYRCDLLPFSAILAIARVLKKGCEKYSDYNWKKVTRDEHINHALTHLFKMRTGDHSEEHLAQALTRLCFAFEIDHQVDLG